MIGTIVNATTIIVGSIIAQRPPARAAAPGRLYLQCGSDHIRIWDKHTSFQCQGEMQPTGDKEFWT